jgi:hypothetical protein
MVIALELVDEVTACRMPSESAVWSPKRSRSRAARSIRRREAIARMAFTWEAVAGRALYWVGIGWLAVTVALWAGRSRADLGEGGGLLGATG